MIKLMDKHSIIKLKREGHSNRKVAKMLNLDRKTVGKYWNEFKANMERIEELTEDKNYSKTDLALLQEEPLGEAKYKVGKRGKVKYTEEMDAYIDSILQSEDKKNQRLGGHKQGLTIKQIHEMLREKGYDIGKSTVALKVKEKREKVKECFIRQEYSYGERLEYDFGEVKLIIGGDVKKII